MKTVIKLTVWFLLPVIAFTTDCSQKKQCSSLEILPEKIIEKIISYTPTATRKNLALVNKAMSKQAYCQLERTNSLKNYLDFQRLLFEYFSPAVPMKSLDMKFTSICTLMKHFLKINNESIMEQHAPNFQTHIPSLSVNRPYVIQLADSTVSTTQSFGIDIKTQNKILAKLLSHASLIEEKKNSINFKAEQRLHQQNQLFKVSVLSLSFSVLSRGNERRDIQKKIFERIFFTLLNINVLEEIKGKTEEIGYNLPDNFPKVDCEYLMLLIKQLNIDVNCKLKNNATLLQCCFAHSGKPGQPKTQFQTMLIYKLIKLGIDLGTTECERTIACFFRNLPWFYPYDQINIFNELIQNNMRQNVYKTILHTYFKYTLIPNINVIDAIVNRASFDINALEPVIFLIDPCTSDSEEEPTFEYVIEQRTSFEYFLLFCSKLEKGFYWHDVATKIVEIFISKLFNFDKKTGMDKSFIDLVNAYLEKDNDNQTFTYLKQILNQNQNEQCRLRFEIGNNDIHK